VLFLRTPVGKYLCNGRDGGESRLRRLLAEYDELYEQFDDRYDKSSTPTEYFELMKALAPLNRATTNLHNAMQSARSYIEGDTFLIAMRDEAYEVSRNFELLTSDVKLALDYQIAENTEQQAARADEMAAAQHKLNVLAAVTFPLMAIATLLGMNLVHGFESEPPVLFWSVVILGFLVGFAVKGWVTNVGGNQAEWHEERPPRKR
jgi:Mg2+ and Co2+ transporter CorA